MCVPTGSVRGVPDQVADDLVAVEGDGAARALALATPARARRGDRRAAAAAAPPRGAARAARRAARRRRRGARRRTAGPDHRAGRYLAPMSPKTLTGAELQLDDGPARDVRALPRRREQPRLPRLLRAARGARDERRLLDERAARLHEHALQAARRLPAEGRRRRLGHAARCTARELLGDLQGGPPADAGPAARAVPVLPPDRRGVRLPQPRVRGLGGGRRDRDPRDARRRGGRQDLRRLDRPRRVPALLGRTSA